ncbi:MAG: Gx transporter family protein [Candidatus Ornithomonoglobus sp.]
MNTKRLTTISMLTALSLIIFIIEAQLPPLAPIPGIKLGLANVITLITLEWFGRKDAFAVLVLRIVLGCIFAGTMMSFMYSLAGGLLCFAVMSLAMKLFKGSKIWVISVFGAISHNIGQIIVAVLITSTWQIAAYLPILLVSAVITGMFTGFSAQAVIKRKEVIFGRKEA